MVWMNEQTSFESNEFKEFPALKKSRKHNHYINQVTVLLACVCRRPILQTQDFIVCKICALRCHPNCVSHNDSSAGKLKITFKGVEWQFKWEIFFTFYSA